jgi:acyl-CoA synthetase (AMP-forming)/AMP-acid ligase II
VVKKAASLGQQCDFVEVRLVDDQGNDVAAGEDGEFVIRGPVLFSHYYNLPQETAESMLPDGWFRTGDMGYQDEEQFYYLRDRKKDMIISGGVNIYPKDIEEVLLMHPDVFEAAVIGFPDEVWGEAVKAFVVLKESAQCDPEELLLFSNEKLAKFQRIKALEFVSSLPRNPSGKVLKRELRLR